MRKSTAVLISPVFNGAEVLRDIRLMSILTNQKLFNTPFACISDRTGSKTLMFYAGNAEIQPVVELQDANLSPKIQQIDLSRGLTSSDRQRIQIENPDYRASRLDITKERIESLSPNHLFCAYLDYTSLVDLQADRVYLEFIRDSKGSLDDAKPSADLVGLGDDALKWIAYHHLPHPEIEAVREFEVTGGSIANLRNKHVDKYMSGVQKWVRDLVFQHLGDSRVWWDMNRNITPLQMTSIKTMEDKSYQEV